MGETGVAPDPAAGPAELEVTDELAAPGRSPGRRRLIFAGRVAVSVAMLAFLVNKLEGEDLATLIPEWTTASSLWLAGAIGLTLAGIVLSALRWQAVLHALGQHPQIRRLLSLYLAGQFVANVLPTSIGGDVLRITRLSRDSGEAHTSFASVVLERLTGWIVLPVITFVGLAVNPGLRHLGKATAVAAGLALSTLLLLAVVLTSVARHDYELRLDEPSGWHRFLAAISFGVNRLRQRPAEVANVVGVGFAYQLVLVLAALMGARALDLPADVSLTALLAFLPAVLIAQVLPISISGLGVREGLLVLLLGPLGVPQEKAIALGLMLYFLNLVVSLLGAPSFAVGHRAHPQPAHPPPA